MMTRQRKIVLDCDPGHDDAVAIMLALSSEQLEVLGITVVAGNQTLEKTARNALAIVEYLHKDVPVVPGSERPLKRSGRICPEIHGVSGLDGFDFPPAKKTFAGRDAVRFIGDVLRTHQAVTLVATGPLTNIAKVLLRYPALKDHIEEIVLMGGAVGAGNMTPFAEFNILVDPEAASIVFSSGVRIRMLGLDVTRRLIVRPDILARMKKIPGPAAVLFTALMKTFNENQQRFFHLPGGPLHDPATIVALLEPAVFAFQPMHVMIDVSTGEKAGQTVCQAPKDKEDINAYVALDVDIDRFWDVIAAGLERAGS